MKKIITISTLFASSAMLAFASTPKYSDSPITAMVAASQKGGADSAKKIMEIQAKEKMDISRDSFLIYTLASCKDSNEALISAAKDGNIYAIKAIKMLKLADAEDTLLNLAKSKNDAAKDAMDALSACGSKKSLNFFVDNMATADASLLGDYVKVSTELYKALDEADKPAMKTAIQSKINSADGKAKTALERIVGSAPAESGEATGGRKGRKKG